MTARVRRCDLCIIGAGSGGLSVAAGAAQLGLDVVLIEKGAMGGDCLNTGCVPSKALLAAAKAAQAHRSSQHFGVAAHEPDIDYAQVQAHVHHTIAQIAPHDSVERFEGLGAEVIQGEAQFVDRRRVTVNGQTIEAKRFVVATGSQPMIPPIEGMDPDKVLTHEDIFSLEQQPSHLIIIGAGPIGMEMAQAHRRLGMAVTVIEQATPLPAGEPEHAERVCEALKQEGVEFLCPATIERVEHGTDETRVVVKVDNVSQVVAGSHLLVAAGRRPQVDNLGLELAGIDHDGRGIVVNRHLKTSNRRVFAIGDVAHGPHFTHWAGYQAGVVIKQVVFKLGWAKADPTALPWVTYTDPELAQVGLTEAQARQQHGAGVKVVRWSMADNDRAVAEGGVQGEVKVTATPKGRILGVSLVGPHAGELIAPWTLMIHQGLKIGAMAQVISPYPTLGEISKRAAGSWYTPSLFSPKTRRLVRVLSKWPF